MLSKSDFLAYQDCAKSAWLKRHKPEAIDWPTPSAFHRMLMQDGYAVEREVRALVASWPDAERYAFQQVFETDTLFARADLIRRAPDGKFDLFEIKGSSSVKSEFITDAAFQVHVARAAGNDVGAVSIIHLNSEYRRGAAIDPAELLTIVDVTAQVEARLPALGAEIEESLAFFAQEVIDEQGCRCVEFGNIDRRCAAFAYFNPADPEHSIYLLPRISTKKVLQFRNEGRLTLDAIAADELTPSQIPIHTAAVQGAPLINKDAIKAFLAPFAWPLHFYDYETFGSAVPHAVGHGPFQQMPVQYSLDVLYPDGSLEHFEYLATAHGQQRALVEHLEASFEEAGTIISWNKSYENSCNARMTTLLPDKAEFLLGLNERTVDLMDPFKSDYVDIRFGGSTSIKKVLPILCPDLQYAVDAVHDGAGAMEAWLQMVNERDDAIRERLAEELRAYCGLDTMAMVAIFKLLKSIC